ncbi:MAG: dihydrofolate reductase family protein [Streptosporangiaceae bacterium]
MPEQQRRVVAWMTISMDGYTSGPGGPAQDAWLHEHALRASSAAHFEGVWRGASTVVVGRTNYEGFYAVWPGITADPGMDPRTRDLGMFLNTVEKVVVSRTLQEAGWENSRITRDLESEVKALRDAPGRDILVINSASIIQALLRAGLIDDLRFAVVPVLLGGGLRLFAEGLPASAWTLTQATILEDGAIGLHYSRA